MAFAPKRPDRPSRRFADANKAGARERLALVAEMLEGDQNALAALYDRTSRVVFSAALRIVGDRVVAEEVVIDVYHQAWRQAALYDERRGDPLAWLLAITLSRSLDRRRLLRRDEDTKRELLSNWEPSTHTRDPERAPQQRERNSLVRAALDDLPATQREVIDLAFYFGMSQTEIAEHLDLPLGTVKTRVRLAMGKLRERLVPLAEELG